MFQFPPGLEPVDDLTPAAWVEDALKDWPQGRRFIVRDLVPPIFEAYARILHRPHRPEDGRMPSGTWSSRAAELGRRLDSETSWRDLEVTTSADGQRSDWSVEEGSLSEPEVTTLSSFLEGHTSTPTLCWFAMWAGWGEISGGDGVLYRSRGGTISELKIRWRNRLESWQARREASLLKTFPLLGDGRRYLLLHGPVPDAESIWSAIGHCPTIWWPDDRAWFVHTEIDALSTYVGGPRTMVDRLVGEQVLESFEVHEDSRAAL